MKRFIVLLLPLLFITACSKKVCINSYADSELIPHGFDKGSSFYVFTKSENGSLLAKEVTRKIERLLKDKGYQKGSRDKADYYLFFDYGMQKEERAVHNFEQVGKTIIGGFGSSYTQHDSAHYNDQVVATQMGYVSRNVMFFTKTMTLKIYDAAAYRLNNQSGEVWHCDVSIDDQDGDLRTNIDFLLVTSIEYMGSNTHSTLCISVKNGNKKIKKLRK